MTDKQLICAALGWREFDYQLFQFNMGCEYLEKKVPNANKALLISRTRSFWVWWVRQWNVIDREIIIGVNLHEGNVRAVAPSLRADFTEFYLEEHSPEEMHVFLSTPAQRAIEVEINTKLTVKSTETNGINIK